MQQSTCNILFYNLSCHVKTLHMSVLGCVKGCVQTGSAVPGVRRYVYIHTLKIIATILSLMRAFNPLVWCQISIDNIIKIIATILSLMRAFNPLVWCQISIDNIIKIIATILSLMRAFNPLVWCQISIDNIIIIIITVMVSLMAACISISLM